MACGKLQPSHVGRGPGFVPGSQCVHLPRFLETVLPSARPENMGALPTGWPHLCGGRQMSLRLLPWLAVQENGALECPGICSCCGPTVPENLQLDLGLGEAACTVGRLHVCALHMRIGSCFPSPSCHTHPHTCTHNTPTCAHILRHAYICTHTVHACMHTCAQFTTCAHRDKHTYAHTVHACMCAHIHVHTIPHTCTYNAHPHVHTLPDMHPYAQCTCMHVCMHTCTHNSHTCTHNAYSIRAHTLRHAHICTNTVYMYVHAHLPSRPHTQSWKNYSPA